MLVPVDLLKSTKTSKKLLTKMTLLTLISFTNFWLNSVSSTSDIQNKFVISTGRTLLEALKDQ